MKSGGVPREESTLMKLLLISLIWRCTALVTLSSVTRRKVDVEIYYLVAEKRGTLRMSLQISMNKYTLLQPKNLAAAHP